MAIERLELEVSLRDGRGKSVTRKLRAQGQVPAVIYGSGVEPTAIVVESLGARARCCAAARTRWST